MLPSSIRPHDLILEETDKGLFIVRNAYKGKRDDFFANSALFPNEPQTRDPEAEKRVIITIRPSTEPSGK